MYQKFSDHWGINPISNIYTNTQTERRSPERKREKNVCISLLILTVTVHWVTKLSTNCRDTQRYPIYISDKLGVIDAVSISRCCIVRWWWSCCICNWSVPAKPWDMIGWMGICSGVYTGCSLPLWPANRRLSIQSETMIAVLTGFCQNSATILLTFNVVGFGLWRWMLRWIWTCGKTPAF